MENFTPQKMVSWFSPKQLARTAMQALLSSIFSTYADKREMQAALANISKSTLFNSIKQEEKDNNLLHLTTQLFNNQAIEELVETTKKTIKSKSFNETHNNTTHTEYWFDYVSDTGDGFDSTYTIAKLISEPVLTINNTLLYKGNLLLLGGDQVYPAATRQEYWNRFVGPFNMASTQQTNNPSNTNPNTLTSMYAIPGNHDWYDGLGNFIKLFCQGRTIGTWQTKQTRSYFSIKLPYNCYIWGIDIQLNSDIDKPQLDYFETQAQLMPKNAKIILITAQPAWIYKGAIPNDYTYSNLKFFEDRFIIAKNFTLLLTISGDLHHYSRYALQYENGTTLHKITAGGGGAFLHPTHNLPKTIPKLREGTFTQQACFPLPATSKNLATHVFLLPYKNIGFGLFLGILYFLLGWQIISYLPTTLHLSSIGNTLLLLTTSNPNFLILSGLLVLGFYFFTDTSTKKNTNLRLLGALHGITHIAAVIGCLLLLTKLQIISTHINIKLHETILISLLLLTFGGIIGGFISSAYLYLCNIFLKMHDNETFSAFAYEGYKNFIRLKLTEKELTIYPIGIKNIARWTINSETPNSDKNLQELPTLIEKEIVIPL